MQKIVSGLAYKPIQKQADSLFLSRQDYKFLIPFDLLEDTLDCLKDDFFCNEYEGESVFKYHNVYYDTKDYRFFNLHRQGKFNRIKIRVRHYQNGNKSRFLECKRKEKGLRVKKERLKIDFSDSDVDVLNNDIVIKHLEQYSLLPEDLTHKTDVGYNRISFVGKESDTRASVDYNIMAGGANGKSCRIVPNHLILEVKSEKYPSAIMRNIKKSFGVQEVNFSKYCVSLCNLEEGLKTNKWKQILKRY